ncbi:MAG: NAD(P)H-quinone oxidoreductase [Geminicoccaceae bacterium]
MRAIIIDTPGEADVLKMVDIADPRPGEGEVVIRAAATAVNRADILQRQGNYPAPPGDTEVPGLEVAGVIDQLGDDTTGWAVGDRVMTIVGGGGYAERVKAPADTLIRVPNRFDLVTAAAIPEVFITAYLNIFREAAMRQSESVLIHGGASGVGTAGIQLAKRLRDATVFATVGSPEKAARCEELGADQIILYKRENFADAIRERTGKHGVDVILDHIGGDYLADNMKALAPYGRLVIIGLMGGAKAELAIGPMMVKRQRIVGSVLRARPVTEKAEIVRAFRGEVMPLFEDGRLQPVIHQPFPLEKVADAHRLVEANKNVGKVLLVIDETVTGKAAVAGVDTGRPT